MVVDENLVAEDAQGAGRDRRQERYDRPPRAPGGRSRDIGDCRFPHLARMVTQPRPADNRRTRRSGLAPRPNRGEPGGAKALPGIASRHGQTTADRGETAHNAEVAAPAAGRCAPGRSCPCGSRVRRRYRGGGDAPCFLGPLSFDPAARAGGKGARAEGPSRAGQRVEPAGLATGSTRGRSRGSRPRHGVF